MKQRNIKLGLALVLVFMSILACDFSASTANIADAMMAKDYDGAQPATIFAQDETFYCIVDLANAPDDTIVKAVWIAVQAEGVDPNFLIDETEITSGSNSLHFELGNDNLWPTGKYKLELYLNGEPDRTIEFEVQQ